MVTKSKDNKATEQTKRRAKVGKLKLNKETIKDLTAGQLRQLKGGIGIRADDTDPKNCNINTVQNCSAGYCS